MWLIFLVGWSAYQAIKQQFFDGWDRSFAQLAIDGLIVATLFVVGVKLWELWDIRRENKP
jgi:hypothetical protein